MQDRITIGRQRPAWDSGYTLIEAILVMAIIAVAAALVVPVFNNWAGELRLQLAANQMAGVLRAARSYAITRNANVAVKFRTDDEGRVTFALYRDGDGDGVLTSDILDGRDPEVWAPREMRFASGGISFGFPPGPPPRHPGQPTRRLDRLEDPIRFNRSDMASFTPLGKATPGSIYLTDRCDRLAAVRVYHRTGKISVLFWDREQDAWI